MSSRDSWRRRLVARIMGRCPRCGGWYALTDGGVVWQHTAWLVTWLRDPAWERGVRCPGAGQPPTETRPGRENGEDPRTFSDPAPYPPSPPGVEQPPMRPHRLGTAKPETYHRWWRWTRDDEPDP